LEQSESCSIGLEQIVAQKSIAIRSGPCQIAGMSTARKKTGPPKGTGGRPLKSPGEPLVDVGLRLRQAVVDQVQAIADGLGVNRSDVMRTLIEEGVARHRNEKSRPSPGAAARAKKSGR
jgi:hypothetical protein